MSMEIKKKKGVSPIVATVLLIVLVVIIALIIFLWARGFVKERGIKTIQGQEVSGEDACKMVKIEADVSGNEITILNKGDVYIYKVEIKKIKSGSSDIEKKGVFIGGGSSKTLSAGLDGYEKVRIVPIILVKTSEGTNEFNCEGYGKEISI